MTYSVIDDIKTFINENTQRRVTSGWSFEEAFEHSFSLIEGLLEGEFTDEGKDELLTAAKAGLN
jgi:hypothetical protein